jgi:outer membrane protein, heavy metal efflux system
MGGWHVPCYQSTATPGLAFSMADALIMMTFALPMTRLRQLALAIVLPFLMAVPGWATTGIDEAAGEEDYYADNRQLAEYVEMTLRRHPGVEQALARYRAALQKVPQVTSLPDPMLNFTQFLRSVETRVGPQVNLVTLSQRFPWFGKLDLQGQIAVKEAAVQHQQYRILQRDLIHQTKRAYYELQYVDRALRITWEEESLLDHYERLAQSRYAAGEGLQQGVIKIQAELTRLVDRVQMLELQRESAVARLNTLMNRPPESPLAAVEPVEIPEVSFSLEELYDLGERNRHELEASLARIEKSERSVELARKDYWPDVTVSAGFINVQGREDAAGIALPPPDNGKNAFNLSVGINLPVWRDKYRAGVVEASESLIASRRDFELIRNEIEFSVRDQALRLQTLSEQIRLYDQVLIPQAEEALRSTESAYETGQVRALDLLDSERFLVSSRLMKERYEIDYLQALAALERAVGTRFPR